MRLWNSVAVKCKRFTVCSESVESFLYMYICYVEGSKYKRERHYMYTKRENIT